MPAALLSREEVVQRLLGVFRRLGYDGASLAELSKATGLGRSSLYHYFPGGKDDMVGAVLTLSEQSLRDIGLAPLRGPGTVDERLRAMLRNVEGFYEGGRAACVLGALALSSAREQFRPRLRDIFGLWISELARVLEEGGLKPAVARERAEELIVEVQGSLVLANALGEPAPFKRVVKRWSKGLLRPDEDGAPAKPAPRG